MAQVQQVLLEGRGDGGFARRGEPREPDCEAPLFAVGGAFSAGEGGVPCYVAGGRLGGCVGWREKGREMYVAMFAGVE